MCVAPSAYRPHNSGLTVLTAKYLGIWVWKTNFLTILCEIPGTVQKCGVPVVAAMVKQGCGVFFSLFLIVLRDCRAFIFFFLWLHIPYSDLARWDVLQLPYFTSVAIVFRGQVKGFPSYLSSSFKNVLGWAMIAVQKCKVICYITVSIINIWLQKATSQFRVWIAGNQHVSVI